MKKNKKTKNKNKHHSIILLDQSGSMQSMRKEAITGFNEQLQDIKELGKKMSKVDLTLTLFGGDVDITKFCVPIESVEELSKETYRPNGGTPMYEAIGETLERLEKEAKDDENTSWLCMVLSDGLENTSSSEWRDGVKLAELIQDREKTGRWTFVYIGANQDLSKVQEDLGLPKGNMASFDLAEGQAYPEQNLGIRSAMRSYYEGSAGANEQATGSSLAFFSNVDDLKTGENGFIDLSANLKKEDEEEKPSN